MILKSLFAGKFQDYFDEVLRQNHLWLFVHIPKTAGSSFNGELVPILFPSAHIFVDYSKVADGSRPFNELLDEAVEDFIAKALAKRYAYVTGHITAGHVARIASALPDTKPITLLRDPVARVVSDYRYQCSDMHPGHADFMARHPTIDTYIDVQGDWNKAASHVIPPELRRAGDPGPCVEHLLNTYTSVGVQELYDLSLRLVTTLAGTPKRPKVFKRVNTPTEETAVTLTEDQEARIRRYNALDIAIYEDIAARFRAIAPDLERYLDVVDPLPPEET